MARGAESSAVQLREQQTATLFNRLADVRTQSDRDALLEEIVQLNLGLCDAIAKRYLNRGADHDDLTQVARMALLLAVERYDAGSGHPFAAYAVPTIVGEVKRHFRDSCWMVRPPRRIQELRARARARFHQLEQSLGRAPEGFELRRELGIDDSDVRDLQVDGSYRPWSLDAPVESSEHQETPLGSMVADPEEPIELLVDRLTLRRCLAALPRRDQLVVKWRFEDEWTQREIGEHLGISQMQVSRILRRVIDRLRAEFLAGDAEPIERADARHPRTA